MSKRQIIQKASWFVAALIAIAVVAVFATVRDESLAPQAAVSMPPTSTPPASLETIINSRTTWDVAFPSWQGQSAADFTVKDIDGQTHNLSDYRGRNLLVVFWATWCPACKAEIPHLIELRKMYFEDELGILAISNESADDLKSFAADNGINYTVARLGSALPEPFSKVTSIPTTFFIGKDGTIKLTALGLVPLQESKAIIEAETGH
ncbi:MAG: TlpA family protein disulfide reductase [Sedimentisphaerales bacterium]|nr:TlpA family protein disulfide reductase [Sedimentisphaerales bacterium]